VPLGSSEIEHTRLQDGSLFVHSFVNIYYVEMWNMLSNVWIVHVSVYIRLCPVMSCPVLLHLNAGRLAPAMLHLVLLRTVDA